MPGKVETLCEQHISKIIENLGYELVEVEYAKKSDGMNLTFVIDSPNGILLEDCEKVHNAINEPLDVLNPTNDSPFILNVSSPGLDRPIKNYKDFLRNKGKKVEIKLFAPKDKCKLFTGELVGYTDDEITITQNGTEINFKKEEVAQIVPVIEF